MDNKMTKKDKFNAIIDILNGATYEEDEVGMLIEFAQHEIELLERKRSTPKAKADNTELENAILDTLSADTGMQVKMILNTEPMKSMVDEKTNLPYSSQKINSILRGLIERGTVVKRLEGKTALFYLA